MSQRKELIREAIASGKTAIGIELGSTRIKTVLIGEDHVPIASGNHDWENSYENGIWTYHLNDVLAGLQASYIAMTSSVMEQYDIRITTTGAIGISAMMHGYLIFDDAGELLTPFRTWRNNITEEASEKLTELFGFHIPQRWSIAHLYQAILNNEAHTPRIDYMTTLAGYLHWQLTGQKVVGIGEASGIFPIDREKKAYNQRMIDQFDALVAPKQYPWRIADLLPRVLMAGTEAGTLTAEGAKLLDPSGDLQAGIPLCPPEGDAGTGMVATNSVAEHTGNVSAGTSVFAMIVLDKDLSFAYPEIDIVTTPEGLPVAMVHSNNCTSDYDAWLGLISEAIQALGLEVKKPQLYDTLLESALRADADGGGLLSYGYISGEHITHFEEGRPLFVRLPGSRFNLPNFMRTQLFASLGVLKTGLKILFEKESIRVDQIMGHGGFFKAREVGQRMMAAAMNVPVSVMETAGEGGAWGIAILASYMIHRDENQSLQEFLNSKVFAGKNAITVHPDPKDVEGYDRFMERYAKGLAVERAAVDNLK